MTELLVSVRSPLEAEAALQGGAGVIDVKEPRHGSMGRASADVIDAVYACVGSRRLVSAALGELVDSPEISSLPELSFAKWGLAGCLHRPRWREELVDAAATLRRKVPRCKPVAVAYADWQLAESPDPFQLGAWVWEQRWGALLLDTWAKNGKTLLDWLSVEEIDRLCRNCRARGVRVALAGSLGAAEIAKLLPVRPDWFAVRRSVCGGGDRIGAIDAGRVRDLTSLIRATSIEN